MQIVTSALKALIAELQTERRRLPNVDGLVFTLDGQIVDELKLEYHFRKAQNKGSNLGIAVYKFLLRIYSAIYGTPTSY